MRTAAMFSRKSIICTCIMWGCGQQGDASNTKLLPRRIRIVQIHESFTPQKLPTIRYVYIYILYRLTSLEGIDLWAVITYGHKI